LKKKNPKTTTTTINNGYSMYMVNDRMSGGNNACAQFGDILYNLLGVSYV